MAKIGTKKIRLNGVVYYFLIDYRVIDVKDIFHIHDYLVKKHIIQNNFLYWYLLDY